MVAKSKARLLSEDAVEALREELLPRATLVTPNVPEAEILTGMTISSVEEQREAARKLALLGPAVLLKGGHLPGDELVDVLVMDTEVWEFRRPRVPHQNTHGTGCVLSAAICAFLALGEALPETVARAEEFLTRALRYALPLGRGHGPVQPLSELRNAAARAKIVEELHAALRRLGSKFLALIPEVGTNFVVATPYALSPKDVAAVDGRITRTLDGIRVGEVRLDASSHMTRFLLAVRELHPEVRAAMNIRYGEDVLAAAKRAGLSAAGFDRVGEPKEEGGSLRWAHTRPSPPSVAFPTSSTIGAGWEKSP